MVALGSFNLSLTPLAGQTLSSSRSDAARVAAERMNNMHAAVTAGLLASGNFQIVSDNKERHSAIAKFQRRMRTLGISATFAKCETIGLLAGESADSSRAYGGYCAVRIGSKPTANYFVCSDNMGPIALIQPDAYAITDEFLEVSMRRSCL